MDIDETRFEANAPIVLDHVELLRSSYKHWTGMDLLPPVMHAIDAQGALFDAPVAVRSHGPEPDPVFKYGNRLALQLFEMEWDEFVNMPSRYTTDPADRAPGHARAPRTAHRTRRPVHRWRASPAAADPSPSNACYCCAVIRRDRARRARWLRSGSRRCPCR